MCLFTKIPLMFEESKYIFPEKKVRGHTMPEDIIQRNSTSQKFMENMLSTSTYILLNLFCNSHCFTL